MMDSLSAFGPDFPYAYDDWIKHPAGLGQVPADMQGEKVAIMGRRIGDYRRLRADEDGPAPDCL